VQGGSSCRAALSTNELQRGNWNFVDGPSCMVASNLSKGETVTMRFPAGWSGAGTAFCASFYTKIHLFGQDRLGTNKKKR
jgi:hypothetical protein